ncbi:hypothetical protein FLK61_36665 [Paenalkalicoccus suaedae]|uniref:Cytosolic protein n=1 Tax=Paenalkalicoccus suaedae TaxID=2592382 RepID=A0A859FGB4_9BACI|nr:hypothetical protein [Paenalkalicoccus suaedae]QKS72179.1 hypothetical protein FLK61_36665 [Paenalkalicoccus suaedae]
MPKKMYEDFSAVEKNRKEVIPEVTPEGPYGAPTSLPPGKSSPWQKGQYSISAFEHEQKHEPGNKNRLPKHD